MDSRDHKRRRISLGHRRRIYSEEKANVIAAVWGTNFIPFLAALAVYFA